MGTQAGRRSAVLPERIGRYAIDGVLGKGGQGVVLSAHDHELDRRVAIKLLKPGTAETAGALASEARIVSRLQHPNIVTLYDIGTYNRMHYLVFEYIEGESLQARIAGGAVPFADCVILMSQILAGVAYLHEHDIVHRDLSPSNILITRDGTPKVTDFGLSVLRQVQHPHDEVIGTLRYMSPEPFQRRLAGPQSDVFTLASIFYEMLSGRRLFDAANPDDIIEAIVEGAPIDFSADACDVDGIIARVLAAASQRELSARYADARAMKNALDEFRLPRAGARAQTAEHGTVEFLMRRMSYKAGFSALSAHIGELLELTGEGSRAPASRLVNIIAKDITLTQRVLTLANSAYYGASEISALGPAVAMLGLDQVRMCITSALLENQFDLGSAALRDALLKSFHSAIFAKAIAAACAVRNRPDAFTCALFHDLGRTLTIHYFADEFDAIQQRALNRHTDELTESRAVLGIAYHELGAAVGNHWKLTRTIVEAMTPLPRRRAATPGDDSVRLQLCAAYANAISRAIAEHAEATSCEATIASINQRVSGAFELAPETFANALTEAAELSRRYAQLLELKVDDSVWATNLLGFTAPDGKT